MDLRLLSTPKKTDRPKATSTPNALKSQHPRQQKQKPVQRITVLNINCRSVKNKIPDLHLVIEQTKPDIICCTETWLKPDIHTSEIFPDTLNYNVFRDDRTHSKGGGVLIAVTKTVVSQEQPDLKTNCNICWAKITIPGTRTIFIGSYYKPHEDDAESLTELWTSLRQLPRNSIVWLLGDFNLPDIDWTNETIKPNCKHKDLYEDFLENLVNLNLEQMVKVPTRNLNTLDLFLTNLPALVATTKTLPSLATSDHDIVFHELKVNKCRYAQPKRKVVCYKKANWSHLKRDMDRFKDDFLKTPYDDVDKAWNDFKNKLKALRDIHIPSKITKSRQDLPWITPNIIRQIRRRDRLYQRLKDKRNADPRLISQFKAIKAAIQKQIRASYWSYLESVIFDGDSQPGRNKKFYSFIKHNKTESFGVSPLKSEGITYTDPIEKANILNKQFESVFTRPQPLSLKHICSAWTDPVRTQMSPISISVDGVQKLLCGLSPNKASGPDELSPRLLKELHTEIAPVLCKIFQMSLNLGTVPLDWRKAIIAPVFKKGPRSKASNYRPISLTCIASKLLEHIIVSSLMKHFDQHELLSPYQHGFRSKRSCETQLISFTQEVFDTMQNGQQTDIIVMDFSKALDKVDHNKLIHKLSRFGVNPHVLRWIRSFLTGRSQRVAVEGHLSEEAPVLSGVPQGSVVGPCLFLTYINDLPDSIKSRARLFADDTIVYLTVKSQGDASDLQNDLDRLEQWERDWSMDFNEDKCEVLRITRKKKTVIYPYRLHNTVLKDTDNAKYLGVNINKDLNWTRHIDNTVAKAKNTLRFIKRNIRTSKLSTKEAAYKTYVRPQLEYCSIIWHPWQKHLTNKIEGVQRAAARYIFNDYSYTSSVSKMICSLHWNTLEQRRIQNSLLMLYKIQHHLVHVDHHHLTQTRYLNFLIPQSRTQYHMNSFFPRTIRYWNNLPGQIKSSPSLDAFRVGLGEVTL